MRRQRGLQRKKGRPAQGQIGLLSYGRVASEAACDGRWRVILARGVFAQLPFGNSIAVHFVRAVGKAQRARARIGVSQREVVTQTAAAMDLLGTGTAPGKGADAALFSPEPARSVYAGSPPPKPVPVSVPGVTRIDHWAKIRESMEEIIKIAREDPSQAQVLYNFMLYGCRTTDAAERVLANLEELGIAIDQLEHRPPRGPYA